MLDINLQTGKLSCEDVDGLAQATSVKLLEKRKLRRHSSSRSVLDMHHSCCVFEELWKKCEKWNHVTGS